LNQKIVEFSSKSVQPLEVDAGAPARNTFELVHATSLHLLQRHAKDRLFPFSSTQAL